MWIRTVGGIGFIPMEQTIQGIFILKKIIFGFYLLIKYYYLYLYKKNKINI